MNTKEKIDITFSHRGGVKRLYGKIRAISISKEKGTKKLNVNRAVLEKDFGIVGDAHAGNWHRQVSLLPCEAIDEFNKSSKMEIKAGEFAENLTIKGIDFSFLKIGTKIKIADQAILEISQIGKDCHNRCHIYYAAGDCIMPKKGIFAKVLEGAEIKLGDSVEVCCD